METLHFPQTERSPLVEFDFSSHRLRIEGESYPEDAAAFFGPILKALHTYLSGSAGALETEMVLDLRMAYFNSSSAKALMNLFQMLEQGAARGRAIQVNWYYHPDDDTMLEFGEDFSEDFQHACFNLRVLDADSG